MRNLLDETPNDTPNNAPMIRRRQMGNAMTALNESLGGRLDAMQLARPVELTGRVTRHDGHLLACDGFPVSVGAVCAIETDTGTPAWLKLSASTGAKPDVTL